MLLVKLLLLLSVALVFAFFRTPVRIWIPAGAFVLLVFTLFSTFPVILLVCLWLLFLSGAAFFSFPAVRFPIFMSWMFKHFQTNLPPLSKSEKEVLDAGDIWWEGRLFSGSADWQHLYSMPKPQLTEKERAFIERQVEKLCAMLDDWKIFHDEREIPEKVWDYIKKERFLGMSIDEKYGGLGFSPFAHSHVITKISSRSMSAGITIMVPNSLGTGEFIQHYGTEEQKDYYLPRLARGEDIPAFALTSPDAGSDAGNIPDTGIVCREKFQGEEVLGIRLNWNKRYITLAPIATLLGLAFKLYDPDHLLGGAENIGITLCLIPTNLPGVDTSKRHLPAGLPFLNGPTHGKDVFVPLSFVIGGREKCGKGWQMMMEGLAAGRGISLPAFSTGGAKLAYRATGAYAALRQQFRLPIGEFEGVMERLARVGGLTYLCETTRYFTLVGLSQGVKPSLASAITKYHLTEMTRQIVNDAMDIHGGRAIQWGPRNYLAALYQALPIGITVEGANILTRNMIIFGQGAMRCHPYVKDEVIAASDPDKEHGLLRFDRLFCHHLGYVICHFAKTLFYGLSGGRLIQSSANKTLAKYHRQLTRMSVALSFVSDVLIVRFEGELKRKEQFSARMGDILSQLYMASGVLKYHYDHESPVEDLPFVYWSLDKCLYEMETAFDALCDNITPRWLGKVLYRLVFPWGTVYRYPKDELGYQIAKAMMKPSEQRDRITQYCYVGNNTKRDPLWRMEEALNALQEIGPLRAKLQTAADQLGIPRHVVLTDQIERVAKEGIFSEEELSTLRHFAALYVDAIQVDEFGLFVFSIK